MLLVLLKRGAERPDSKVQSGRGRSFTGEGLMRAQSPREVGEC
jgi:hypothetical protein